MSTQTATLTDIVTNLEQTAAGTTVRVALHDETAYLWATPIHDCAACGPTGPLFDTLDELGNAAHDGGVAYTQVTSAHQHIYTTDVQTFEADEADALRAAFDVLYRADLDEAAEYANDVQAILDRLTAAGAELLHASEGGGEGAGLHEYFVTCEVCDKDLIFESTLKLDHDLTNADRVFRDLREHLADECGQED